MKICFLADSGSIHTEKWCDAFVKMGHDVSLISFNPNCQVSSVSFYHVDAGPIQSKGGNWKVLLKYRTVKKVVRKINPDILHAHYATSYGLVGALTNFHPFAITAHGSDVLISASQSKIYRFLLKYAFKKADWINLVSNHMVSAVNKIGAFNHKIDVIPFGINRTIFNSTNRPANSDTFIITSTRSFEPVYNLAHLIKSVAKMHQERPNIQLNLIGSGSEKKQLQGLVSQLKIEGITKFYGHISQLEIAKVLSVSNVYCSVSLSDGNSISLVEALACGCLPIVSNIEANYQWIKEGETGFLVEVNDVEGLKNRLIGVYDNYETLAPKMQPLNQQQIEEKADIGKNLSLIEKKYSQLITTNL
jgi:glycosyltransferase involved in cell wall biosynthesis